MSFSPEPATAAWVLTGALSLCTLIFIPALGFLLAREYSRRDSDRVADTKKREELEKAVRAMESTAHNLELLIAELRLWVHQGFVPKPECQNNHQELKDQLSELKDIVRDK